MSKKANRRRMFKAEWEMANEVSGLTEVRGRARAAIVKAMDASRDYTHFRYWIIRDNRDSTISAAKVDAPEAMATFAQSEREAEMERCCADICHHCASKSDKYITRAKKVSGKWMHEEIGFERERGGFDCYAAAIRERWAGKREG
jgi:hypothetical protein